VICEIKRRTGSILIFYKDRLQFTVTTNLSRTGLLFSRTTQRNEKLFAQGKKPGLFYQNEVTCY